MKWYHGTTLCIPKSRYTHKKMVGCSFVNRSEILSRVNRAIFHCVWCECLDRRIPSLLHRLHKHIGQISHQFLHATESANEHFHSFSFCYFLVAYLIMFIYLWMCIEKCTLPTNLYFKYVSAISLSFTFRVERIINTIFSPTIWIHIDFFSGPSHLQRNQNYMSQHE